MTWLTMYLPQNVKSTYNILSWSYCVGIADNGTLTVANVDEEN